MIDQVRIQQFVRRLIKTSSVEERQAINPPREWGIGILLTLIGVCVGGGVSYLLYLNTISSENMTDSVVVEPAVYKGVVVEEAAIRFRERSARYEAIRDREVNAVPVAPVTATTTQPTEVIETPVTATPIEPVVEDPVTPVSESGAEEGAPTMAI